MRKQRAGGRQRGSKDKPHAARTFAVRFRAGGWQVQQGRHWRRVREVSINAGLVLALPGGEIRGEGVVTEHGDVIAITS